MKTTSLKLGKALREVAVAVESEFYLVEYPSNEYGKEPTLERPVSYQALCGEMGAWIGKKGKDWIAYHAYTLQELREVLIELGKIKGYLALIGESDEVIPWWKVRFEYICSLFAEEGELGEGSKVEDYINNLLK